MYTFDTPRKNMVDGQIKPNQVTNPSLIEVLARIPREDFVPETLKPFAYVDEDLDLGAGRFLMEPMVTARLIQAATVTTDDIVLEICCGTGYTTALLSALAATVVAIDPDHAMAEKAEEHLRRLGALNVACLHQNTPEAGYPAQAPYDVIYINGAVEDVPQALFDQLNDNGGRLVTVVSSTENATGKATLFRRGQNGIDQIPLFDAGTPRLPWFQKPRRFRF